MHRASHRYLVGTHDRCTHIPKRRLEIFAEGREKFCEYFRGRICGIYSGESSLKSRGYIFSFSGKKKVERSVVGKKKRKRKGSEEKEEAEMNGNVAKDPISKSSSPDREEKEKLLTSLTQPAPVIVKLQKSSNSSFRSR